MTVGSWKNGRDKVFVGGMVRENMDISESSIMKMADEKMYENKRIQDREPKARGGIMNSDLMKNKEVHENKNTDLQRNELDKISESGVITGKRKILIIEDNKLNQEMLGG